MTGPRSRTREWSCNLELRRKLVNAKEAVPAKQSELIEEIPNIHEAPREARKRRPVSESLLEPAGLRAAAYGLAVSRAAALVLERGLWPQGSEGGCGADFRIGAEDPEAPRPSARAGGRDPARLARVLRRALVRAGSGSEESGAANSAGSEAEAKTGREGASARGEGSMSERAEKAPTRTHEPRRPGDYLADLELLPPRILLAEDDPEMRALVSGDLRQAGYSVVECADGASLLRKLDSGNRNQGMGVDLVVADVRMPALTGLDALEHLRSADPFMPYIVVTAFGSAETRRAAKRLGAMAVLDKPFEIGDLLRLVEDAVGLPSRTPR